VKEVVEEVYDVKQVGVEDEDAVDEVEEPRACGRARRG
jgi:hypothetical protein